MVKPPFSLCPCREHEHFETIFVLNDDINDSSFNSRCWQIQWAELSSDAAHGGLSELLTGHEMTSCVSFRVAAQRATVATTWAITPASCRPWRSSCSLRRRTGRFPSCWLPSCTWATCASRVNYDGCRCDSTRRWGVDWIDYWLVKWPVLCLSARTYDNLDACVVVRSPDLVTAASLMEVCDWSSERSAQPPNQYSYSEKKINGFKGKLRYFQHVQAQTIWHVQRFIL